MAVEKVFEALKRKFQFQLSCMLCICNYMYVCMSLYGIHLSLSRCFLFFNLTNIIIKIWLNDHFSCKRYCNLKSFPFRFHSTYISVASLTPPPPSHPSASLWLGEKHSCKQAINKTLEHAQSMPRQWCAGI